MFDMHANANANVMHGAKEKRNLLGEATLVGSGSLYQSLNALWGTIRLPGPGSHRK
jgi:hypothetical protein